MQARRLGSASAGGASSVAACICGCVSWLHCASLTKLGLYFGSDYQLQQRCCAPYQRCWTSQGPLGPCGIMSVLACQPAVLDLVQQLMTAVAERDLRCGMCMLLLLCRALRWLPGVHSPRAGCRVFHGDCVHWDMAFFLGHGWWLQCLQRAVQPLLQKVM